MTAKTFKELFAKARKSEAYWLEGPVLDFTEGLFRLMEERNVTRSDLARRLGTSPAYVTKVLRGNANFTLASMVKLARALDHEVRVHLGPRETVTQWVDVPWRALTPQPKTSFTFSYHAKAVPSVSGKSVDFVEAAEPAQTSALKRTLSSEDLDAAASAA